MTHETDAMDARRLAAIGDAKAKIDELEAMLTTQKHLLAKRTIEKRIANAKRQIHAFKHELNAPETDAFELNSRGNVEGGLSG